MSNNTDNELGLKILNVKINNALFRFIRHIAFVVLIVLGVAHLFPDLIITAVGEEKWITLRAQLIVFDAIVFISLTFSFIMRKLTNHPKVDAFAKKYPNIVEFLFGEQQIKE